MRKKPGTFYCFTPQIMALTFAAEMILMLSVLVRRGIRSVEHRIVVLLLLFLAIFQLSEYGVCESLGFSPEVWARIGFVSITMLPPMGLHLVQRVRKDRDLRIAYIGYFLSLVFVIAFVFFDSFSTVGCDGNYAIFHMNNGLGGAYFAYYYVLLLVSVIMAVMGRRNMKSESRRLVLLLIVAGYASFVVPATYIHFVIDGVDNGLPSIMCGFALIFAVILGTVIANRLPDTED